MKEHVYILRRENTHISHPTSLCIMMMMHDSSFSTWGRVVGVGGGVW